MNFDKLGGRRYVLAQEVFLASCILLAWGKIAGAEWVTVTLGIAGVYVVGNVSQRKIEAGKPAE